MYAFYIATVNDNRAHSLAVFLCITVAAQCPTYASTHKELYTALHGVPGRDVRYQKIPDDNVGLPSEKFVTVITQYFCNVFGCRQLLQKCPHLVKIARGIRLWQDVHAEGCNTAYSVKIF